jgi:hypothetical protein
LLTAECKDYFSKSLFVVGEGTDYKAPLFSGVAFSDVKTYVPLVAKAISNGDIYGQLGYQYLPTINWGREHATLLLSFSQVKDSSDRQLT